MPKRIQRQRTAGWRMPEGVVYVGRPTIYGNPFEFGNDSEGRKRAAGRFAFWIRQDVLDSDHWEPHLIVQHAKLKAALASGDLRGKDLACWCWPGQRCHADVLLEIANGGKS